MDFLSMLGIGFSLVWIDKGVKKGLQETREEMRLLERGIRNLGVGAHAVRSSLDRIGGTVSGAANVVSRMMGGMVSSAVDFDDAMRRALSSLGMEEFQKNFEPLRQAALDIAQEFGAIPADVARGMEAVVKGGVQGAEQIRAVTRAAAQGAMVDSSVTANQMAEMLIDVSKAFGDTKLQGVKELSDWIYAANASSTINNKDLRESLKFAAPQAAMFGLDKKSVLAAIATLGERGIKGSLAGTALERMFLGLTTAKSQRLQQGLGFSPVDAEGQWKSYVQVALDSMDAIDKARAESHGMMTDLDEAAIMNQVFKERGSRAVISLAADEGAAYQRIYNLIENSNSAQSEATQIIQGGLKNAWGRLNTAIQRTAISVMDEFSPQIQAGLENAIKWTGDLLKAFVNLGEEKSLDGLSQSAVDFAKGIKLAVEGAKEAVGWLKDVLGDVSLKLDETFGPGTAEKVAKFAGAFVILSPFIGPIVTILSNSVGLIFSAVTLFTGMGQAFIGLTQILGGAGGLLTKLGGGAGLLGMLRTLAPWLAIGGLIALGDWGELEKTVSSLSDAFEGLWDVIDPVLGFIEDGVRGMATALSSIVTGLIKTFFDPLGEHFEGINTDTINMMRVSGIVAAGMIVAWVAVSNPIWALIIAIGVVIQRWEDLKKAVGDFVDAPGAVLRGIGEGMRRATDPNYRKQKEAEEAARPGGVLWDFGRGRVPKEPPSPSPATPPPNTGVNPEPAAKPKPATTASAGDLMGPPVELKNEVYLDGKKVGGGLARRQLEIAERAGAKASPWTRRATIERGVISPTVMMA